MLQIVPFFYKIASLLLSLRIEEETNKRIDLNIYLLLNILNLFNIVYIGGKRTHEDISGENDTDSDKTPTNELAGEDDDQSVTPNETINDITDMKNTLGILKRALNGEPITPNERSQIEEEYSAFFDDESGNRTRREAYEEVKNYLEGELDQTVSKAGLAGLKDALDEIMKKSEDNSSEPSNKKAKTNEENTSREGVSETQTESSSTTSAPKDTSTVKSPDSESPIDYVLRKQECDPYDPTDDID